MEWDSIYLLTKKITLTKLPLAHPYEDKSHNSLRGSLSSKPTGPSDLSPLSEEGLSSY